MVFEGETEPDWTWWHHTPESRAGSMVGLSFSTPAGPTLTNIEANLNSSNVNEAIVSVKVDSIYAGSFDLVLFDTSDSEQTPISIGPFSFSSSSTPTTSSHTVVIRPSGLLWYGKTYTVKTLSSPTLFVVHSSPTFQIPSLLRAASSSLNLGNLDEVILSLTAFGFPVSTPITLTIVDVDDNDDPKGSTFELTGMTSATEDSPHILATLVEVHKLQHVRRFEITQCDITGRKTVLNGRVFFRVPHRPTLTGVDFSFATTSHTTYYLILNGTDLPVGETFIVSLDGFDEKVEVTFTTPNGGLSTELALGWSDTLQFDTVYPLLSVIHKGLSGFVMPFTDLTLHTKPCPNPLILYATDSENSDPKFCGAVERPCSSVDVAWTIVEAFSARAVSLVLINQLHLPSPISIGAGQGVVVKPHLLPPTLVVPSTASLTDATSLVSVAGTLSLKDVSIKVLVDALSFVLFDVEGGKLVMESVHVSGVPSSSDLLDGIEGLCSWETGLIKLHDAEMETHSCEFSSIEMGEIWMESSNLSLTSTQILSNGARFSLFPSAQQDVMCKSGNITILPSSSDTSEDRWISSTSECSVVLNGSELKTPHFVPSLDTNKSKSTQSKKKDSFSVSIVGSKLIPCDLKLEVSESSSSSHSLQSNKVPVLIPLSFSSVDSWNETHITMSIASSSLSSLSLNEKWTACIVFGMDQHTDSFVFLETLKERKAEALRESLRWLIPVIVCSVLLLLAVLIVIVVLVWRRKKQPTSSNTEKSSAEQELAEDVVVKVEVEETMHRSTENVIGEKSDEDGRFGLMQHNPSPTIEHGNVTAKEGSKMGIQVEAMKCQDDFGIVMVNDADTLFNKLHTEHADLGPNKALIQRQIVLGLQKITEQNTLLHIAAKISSHSILLDSATSVLFKIDTSHSNLDQVPTNNLRVKDDVEEIRWRAPEQGEKEGEVSAAVDNVKAPIFRLGLILWEIETGQVPFGEIDAVNAHRQLAAGISLPLQKIADSSMRDLIVECLRVDPDERHQLTDILSKL
ncbi:hypothetical protein BLNAU_14148 [Blattamonas nauphoetae]|uniref:Protein kinase domain-containing protein n=1 Tax=Blattamonas nauphoetae TaxID=2049346 RepID=A0ABQ9XHY4_9EUKA|nr:hypothetical protein BLNAU_14148 [Blattamonas nauphoetae]